MTDSTIDNKSGDGSFDLGPSVDELFGDIEDESSSERVRNEEDDGATTEDTADDGIEDQTAADVFNQLRDEATDTGEADIDSDILEDESPTDIIASADEPTDDAPTVDDDLLVDEHALENLLLTGRTKEDEFLWVDDGSSAETGGEKDGTAGDEQHPVFDGANSASTEPVENASSATDSDSVTDESVEAGSTGGSAGESDGELESSDTESRSESLAHSRSKSAAATNTNTDTDTDTETDATDTARSSSSTTSGSSNTESETTPQKTSTGVRKANKRNPRKKKAKSTKAKKTTKAKKAKTGKKAKKAKKGPKNSESEDSSRSLFERLGSKVGRLFS
ncbi:hypothetical protein [Halomontanus rarus]|uniref:hypothetical protein n=1 Tax=Halomontanus rarus TaxID=3034020 RepID=UPI0023E8B751|nr:hypothetical protein [Halovivax sp. TS33]